MDRTEERYNGVLVLDLVQGRYAWDPAWRPWPGVLELVACITPDDRLWEQELGTVAGGVFRPRGGRRRLA